ncbi:CDP-diacylglycerol--serine O-phosphatidyltransferase [Paenibacillus sp. Soil766]|uniref:CDP-diacylglycerol--serine O-phosphatidyltransferase n=1 Tax=Paenibacillus sp. Soil766 TaxID=1736404 RepID=UPI0007109D63|nr:CDP-diacylglycerol--serine O-phosphatidyltransferase [Paenibacillus sp. Soil766]KRE93869.1 CDP-diacylglycerol--serine O-phosphatidyltransferase [Paenibacillus sp. Soil766]
MLTKSIPSLFTVGNLFLGVLSIILAFSGEHGIAAVLVIVAMLLDGLDGRVARALNAQSEFGKELDSLSDVISFGVAPAFIMYVVAFNDPTVISPAFAWIVTAIFPICGALRLARFNVVAGTPGYFIGLPIPAAGGVLCTLALFVNDINVYVLLVSTVLLSYLMVSTVKYPNFKKAGIPKAAIWITPIIVAAAVLIAIKWPESISKMIFVPLLMYALYGLKKNVDGYFIRLRNLRRKNKRRGVDDTNSVKSDV